MFGYLYAQGTQAAPQQGDFMRGFLPIIVIFLIFYLLIIRPQSKRQKAAEKKRNSLQKGDRVITSGGIIAKVEKVKDNNIVVLKIAEGVEVEVVKSTIADFVELKSEKEGSGAEKSNPKKHKETKEEKEGEEKNAGIDR